MSVVSRQGAGARIALFDLALHPIGGDITWCRNVRFGLEALGHQVTYLRANHAGAVDGARAFQGYTDLIGHDVVIFSDVVAGHPQLVQLIDRCNRDGVPTVVGLQNNLGQHPEARRLAMIDALNTATHPWTTDLGMVDDRRVRDPQRFRVLPLLPFKPARLGHWDDWTESDWAARRGFLMTGRIATPKGQRVMAELADELEGPVLFQGKAQFKSAVDLREAVVNRGGRVVWAASAAWSSPWLAETVRGNQVRYLGDYDQPDQVRWDRATVHVNLSGARHSVGHLEYSTLEALDAGLRAVVPDHVNEAYRAVSKLPTDGWHTTREWRGVGRQDRDYLVHFLNSALKVKPVTYDEVRSDLGRHDPVRYVTQLLP